MAFNKSKKVKAQAPVVVDQRGAADKDVIIARQSVALEKAWRERDAVRDKAERAEALERRVKVLEIELAELRAANRLMPSHWRSSGTLEMEMSKDEPVNDGGSSPQ